MRSPSPDLLQLGRGILRWAPIVAGVRKPWLDMGNVEQLTIATADTKLTKKSSRVAANVTYKEITSEREVTLTIQGDEFNDDVMAALVQGSAVTVVASAGGAVVDEALGIPGTLGVLFKLANPLVSSVVLSQGVTDFTEGDDYEVVDAARGFVRLFTVAEGGTMDPAVAVVADYNWAVAAAYTKLQGGTAAVVEASFMFAADNAQGPNRDAIFYRASLTPDGELGFITPEFGTWSLKCKLLDDSAGLFGGSVGSPLYKMLDKPVAV